MNLQLSKDVNYHWIAPKEVRKLKRAPVGQRLGGWWTASPSEEELKPSLSDWKALQDCFSSFGIFRNLASLPSDTYRSSHVGPNNKPVPQRSNATPKSRNKKKATSSVVPVLNRSNFSKYNKLRIDLISKKLKEGLSPEEAQLLQMLSVAAQEFQKTLEPKWLSEDQLRERGKRLREGNQ